jgi:hypothetical protein
MAEHVDNHRNDEQNSGEHKSLVRGGLLGAEGE